MNEIDYFSLFITFLFAFIVKDFYDILIQSHIKLWLSKYKILITKINKEVMENGQAKRSNKN